MTNTTATHGSKEKVSTGGSGGSNNNMLINKSSKFGHMNLQLQSNSL